MKLIASILVLSMVFLGLSGFAEGMNFQGPRSKMSCGMDCCDQLGDCCDDETPDDQGSQEEQDSQCPPDCDCSYEFQLVAIEYHFVTSCEIAPMAVHYGTYTNTYHFEYFKPLLQPPRFS